MGSEGHKKTKKSKHNEKSQTAQNWKQESSKLASLNRKQTEVARVYDIKCNMLLQGNVTYLEYMELREEIMRLNLLRESLARKVSEYEKN